MIWLKWNKHSLRRQVEYGARLGQVDLAMAKNELEAFFEHEEVVIEYFRKRKMLYLVGTVEL